MMPHHTPSMTVRVVSDLDAVNHRGAKAKTMKKLTDEKRDPSEQGWSVARASKGPSWG